ncbi:MAG: peptidoglycan bridge formation glycyltransferase FemA/FemB family protein [Patescibacteria group bacterium]|nr:peptidoglycan bridge formation glycyltransferase FemA/FemB family protein [Patescibacteria group bacterium]
MQLSNLLQSVEWEEFEKALGHETFWIDNALLIKNHLFEKKNYFYCPRGPFGLTKEFLDKAIELGKKENSIFIRVEPIGCTTNEAQKCINQTTRENPAIQIKKTKDINPPSTLILDLTRSDQEILSEMKQKTRYNINLARKKGVEIEVTTDSEKAEIFYRIMKETTDRDGFSAHSLRHYKKQLEILGRKGIIKLYLAKYDNKYIAANMVSFFGNTVSYLHGASSNEYRNVMAPYLLQWEAILDSKEGGFAYYDFWGIAPDDNIRHKWAGVTRFKKGFGGTQIDYPGTYDVVISKWGYFLYKFGRVLNVLIRKL